uniref:Putative ovule protein n=1 Tax=Solanum chacoense TaxID=4108 RepID=A0A0V0GY28_SOLCH
MSGDGREENGSDETQCTLEPTKQVLKSSPMELIMEIVRMLSLGRINSIIKLLYLGRLLGNSCYFEMSRLQSPKTSPNSIDNHIAATCSHFKGARYGDKLQSCHINVRMLSRWISSIKL